MPRTTPELVSEIIDVEEGDDLDPFILAANELVTEVCEPVITYSLTRLELIERWLAAHFYSVKVPRNFLENVASLREQKISKVALGFDLTHHGQQALRLDTAGGLAVLNAQATTGGKVRPRRTVRWLGTPRDEV